MTCPLLTIMVTALLLIAVAAVKTAIDAYRKEPSTAEQGKPCVTIKEVSPPPRAAMHGKQLRKFGENLQKGLPAKCEMQAVLFFHSAPGRDNNYDYKTQAQVPPIGPLL